MDRRDLLPPGPGSELTPAELRLVDCAASGKFWRPLIPDGKEWDRSDYTKNDPAKADSWPDDCKLRPEVIRCLLTGARWSKDKYDNEPWLLHPKGLRIINARIEGNLDLEGCELIVPLSMGCCAIRGTLVLQDSKTQTLAFIGSHVGSFNAHRARIDGSLHLRDKFRANGGVNLGSAKISGQLACAGGRFENRGKVALRCDALTVSADVFLTDEFHAIGEVNFGRATIAGSLNCQGGRFENAEGTALRLASAKIGAGLSLTDIALLDGLLDLHQADVRTLRDDGLAWSKSGSIVLDGFTYQRFSGSLTGWKKRLEWLNHQPPSHLSTDFRPQPWAQLIKVLREMGHEDDAREIAIVREKILTKNLAIKWMRLWQRLRRRESLLKKWHRKKSLRKTLRRKRYFWKWLWRKFLEGTTGNGYRPWKAMRLSLYFLLIGWFTFGCAANLGYMSPRESGVITYLAAHPEGSLPQHYTKFNAFIYALDVYLPVIELGQAEAWEPSVVPHGNVRGFAGNGRFVACATSWAFGKNSGWEEPNTLSCGVAAETDQLQWPSRIGVSAFAFGAHRLVYWVEELAGWVFVSLFIAGMSGIMKKE